MKIKILKPFSYLNKTFRIGDILEIKSENGVAIDSFWNNRIKDSAMDNCIEILPIKTRKEEKNVKYKQKSNT